jgi:uncharacterized protein (TIGR00255 family)
MIKSMTGFGRATSNIDNRTFTVEVKSVNSKSLDLNLRLPTRYREKEQEIKNEIGKELERGKIDVSCFIESSETAKNLSVNKELVKAYYKELKEVDEDLKLKTPDFLSLIMRMPEVMTSEQVKEIEESEWLSVSETIKSALISFNEFRSTEGATLQKELSDRINNIETLLKEIEIQEPQRIDQIRNRLQKNITEFIPSVELDKNRLEQEMIYFIEKLDITEEKVRLRSHCTYFKQTMNESISNGRKLGFITQEIGREINTIGSKANDAVIQRCVVQMKDELEKVKEQVLNIL